MLCSIKLHDSYLNWSVWIPSTSLCLCRNKVHFWISKSMELICTSSIRFQTWFQPFFSLIFDVPHSTSKKSLIQRLNPFRKHFQMQNLNFEDLTTRHTLSERFYWTYIGYLVTQCEIEYNSEKLV